MFRGFEQAKIDDKGRLKIPARFREKLIKDYGADVFLTAFREHQLCIYPIRIWEQKEELLGKVPDSLPEKNRFILTANYFGSEKSVDEQGRLPLPQHLRDKVGLDGDVAVIGNGNFMVVMNLNFVDRWANENSPTPDVFDKMQAYGI